MEKKTAKKVPLWKLLIAINAMIEEGYSQADVTIEDEDSISLRGAKEKETEELPDINQLEL